MVLKHFEEIDLPHAIEHLVYEISMLEAVAARLSKFQHGDVKNALVESLALHTRNLIEFYFYSEGGKDDDLRAVQFCKPETTWPHNRSTLNSLQVLSDAAGRANKQVSHLTLDRGQKASHGKGWPTDELLTALRIVHEEFRTLARPEVLVALDEKMPPIIHQVRN